MRRQYLLKKFLIGIAAVAVLVLMIGSVFANGGEPCPTPTPPCTPTPPPCPTPTPTPCPTPTPTPPPCGKGLSPGFWKHNVGVYLGYSHGSYSDPEDSAVVSKTTMGSWLAGLGLDLQALYDDLNTKGGGAAGAETRVNAANVFNALAGLYPYGD